MNNKFLKICKDILLKYYIYSKEAVLFFNKFKPEAILLYMLEYFKDEELKQRLKQFIRTNGYDNLSYHSYYIIDIYKNLGVKCLDITYSETSGIYFLNLYKFFKSLLFNKETKKLYIDRKIIENLTVQNEIDEIKDILDKVPDVLIFHSSNKSEVATEIMQICYEKLKEHNPDFGYIYDAVEKYKIEIKGLNEYKDEIEFNGHKYKLESCLLYSYNTKNPNSTSIHLITGLTCKKKRFVYNGWDRKKTDEEKKIFHKNEYIACPLKKYNWDLHTHQEMCFKSKNCILLTDIEKTNYCFSFNNFKNGTLIYVRIDETNISKDIDDIKENLSLSPGFAKIVKDMHDIKTLSEQELIEQLKAFDVNIEKGQKPTIKKLQKMLYDKLTDFFKININSKLSEEITSPHPKTYELRGRKRTLPPPEIEESKNIRIRRGGKSLFSKRILKQYNK